MCGIVGAIDSNPNGLIEKVTRANNNLSHRGPDGNGIKSFDHESKSIVFAHSRLSIIDLSNLGYQPMCSEDGRYWITYNGEVYNYKEIRSELIDLGYSFKSDTDTEVLLNSWIEWGSICLTKFTGMFAFVIYDLDKKRVYCVRDAFGIKPFYYFASKERFYFSSEIPSLFLLIDEKKKLNPASVVNYLLRSSYDVAEYTLTREIIALKPGCFLTINLDNLLELKEERWWKPSIEENRRISFNDSVVKLRELFLKSVKLHMRSDVPIGAALSGGIDSSAIVCAMRYLEPNIPIHTFSYIASNSSVDEEKWIDIVNNHVGAIPHKIQLSYKNLADEIDDLIKAQGEPFGSTSIYAQYRVFKSAKENGITVILEGQGADEMLAGYFGYPEHVSMSYFDKGAFLRLFKFLHSWSKLHNQPSKPIVKYIFSYSISILLKGVSKNIKRFYRLISSFHKVEPGKNSLTNGIRGLINKFYKTATPVWLVADADQLMKEANDQINQEDEEIPIRGRRLVYELRRSLVGHHRAGINSLLRHGDRNAMKWSVEGRVPFLTIEMAEFLLSLPEDYLLSKDGLTKNVFRQAMRGIVPDEILDRTDKIGFATPEQEWTRNMNVDEIERVISDVDFLNEIELQNEVKETLNGSRPFSWFAWRVINFSRWLEVNKTHIESNVR